MSSHVRTVWTLAAVIGAGLTACGGAPLSGPPTLHLGRDECAGCGMIISEERSAAALLMEEGGERRHLVFDDIGCMLDYEREHAAGARVIERYVHDYGSREWGPGGSAVFLIAEDGKLATPMGSGIVAFLSGEAAERQRTSSGGRVTDLAGVRDEWSGKKGAGSVAREGR